MMVERHRLFAALRSVTWMDVCGDGLHASIGIGVLSLRKADGGTALIEDIHCEKIRGCSYRRQIADVGQRRRICFSKQLTSRGLVDPSIF
jgi:hypothetical protein